MHVHAACLGLQHGPVHDWNCPYCLDKIVPARKALGKSKPFNVRRVVKAPEHIGGGCVLCRYEVNLNLGDVFSSLLQFGDCLTSESFCLKFYQQ